MFGRATIRLGIGPHSSLFVVYSLFFFVWFRSADEAGYSSAFRRTLIYSIVSYRVVSRRLATIDMGRKRGLCAFGGTE